MNTTDYLLAAQKFYAARQKGAQLNEEQQNYITYAAKRSLENGIDPNVALAILFKESRFGADKRKGAAGENGITQIMPTTAKDYGLDSSRLQADPAYAIDSMIGILKKDLASNKWTTPQDAGVRWNGGNKGSKNRYAQNYGNDVAGIVQTMRNGGANIINIPQEMVAQQPTEYSQEIELRRQAQAQMDNVRNGSIKRPVASESSELANALGGEVTELQEMNPLDNVEKILSSMWDGLRPTVMQEGARDYGKPIKVEAA